MILEDKRIHKPGHTISRVSRIFIELLFGFKGQLAPLQRNLSNGYVNPNSSILRFIKFSGRSSIFGPPALAGRVQKNRVHPFVLPSVHPSLPQNWPISFLQTEHGVTGPYLVTCDRAGFYGKNSHRAKITKNCQKWPKKLLSLVLSGICLKWKFLWLINILRKLHAWEKSSAQVIAKMVLSQWDFSIL